MPHRRPGWSQPNGHIVRSHTEAALCDYLTGAGLDHLHWALSFDVPIARKQWLLFVPSILLKEVKKDDRAVIIEPVSSTQPGGGVRRLQSFRKEHAREYFVIVVARRVLLRRISKEAYDAIFPLEDFVPLGNFLREP